MHISQLIFLKSNYHPLASMAVIRVTNVLSAALFIGVLQLAVQSQVIDSNLSVLLRQKKPVNVLVSMKESSKPLLAAFALTPFPTRALRLNTVATTLQNFAAASQYSVLNLLAREQRTKSFRVKSLWITNQIIIRGADADLLYKLAARTEISRIVGEFFIPLEKPLDLTIIDKPPADEQEIQWGVRKIEAPLVWASGNTGKGVIVATVDTGVRGTHEALKNNFVGDYGWFDPGAATAIPNDSNGHGTHTTATIAGTARNVGVAPDSKWAACKGCAHSSCSSLDLLECGQWIACPTKANGSDPDCSRAPHVVSNSWGGGHGDDWYQRVVDVYQASGIVPLFSIGNSGPQCGSAKSPGDYENVIAVGSTTTNDTLSKFSSVGPTSLGARLKPDVVAPGSEVLSAHHLSDKAYAKLSGTSMACPHAAGVVALMLSAKPNLTYQEIKRALEAGSSRIAGTGKNCGGIDENMYPNHHVGFGRISAVKSLNVSRHI